MTEYDLSVMRGAALMEAYGELTGADAPAVEELIVDLVAYLAANKRDEPEEMGA